MKKLIFSCTLLVAIFSGSCLFGQNPLSKGDHFANVNGIKLHYYVSGSGPVCLFPSVGWGPSVDLYEHSLKPLEKYFTIVYYDTRISGQSSGPEDSTKYTNKDFATDMDSLRIYLGKKKVWIMGHSSGGYQVLYYGIHYNNHLNGIIAIDADAGQDSISQSENMKNMKKRQGQPYFEKGFAIMTGTDTTQYKLAEMLRIIIPFYFHDTNNIAKLMVLSDFENKNTFSDKASKYTNASHFGELTLFSELNKINVPVLVIVGDDDFVCDKISGADRITKNIPLSTEIVIKNAGHFPWLEQSNQFFDETGKWLKTQIHSK